MRILLLAALSGSLVAGAQWTHVPYELPQARYTHAVTDDLGHITLCGSVQTEVQQLQALLVRLDANGNPLLSTTFGSKDKDHLTFGLQTADGHYLWTGHQAISQMPLDVNGWAVKTDWEGNVLWECEWGAIDGVFPQVAVEWPSGKIMSLGSSEMDGTPASGSIAHITSEGEVTAIQTLSETVDLCFTTAHFNGDQTELYVAGTRAGYPTLLALDEAGTLLWEWTSEIHADCTVTGMLEQSDGTFLLAGTVHPNTQPSQAFRLICSPSDWIEYTQYQPACNPFSSVVCLHASPLPDGGVVLTGDACGDAWICCLDSAGEILQETAFDLDDPLGESLESSDFVQMQPNQTLLIAGNTISLDDDFMTTRPLAATFLLEGHGTGVHVSEFLESQNDPVVQITDVLGRTVKERPGELLFFRHQSGRIQKRYTSY